MPKSLEIAIAAAFSALLIAGGHWFPWPLLFHRQLHRLEAYLFGVGAILGPACAVLALHDNWQAIALLAACAASAGLMTAAAKAIDTVAAWRNELLDRRSRDAKARPDAGCH